MKKVLIVIVAIVLIVAAIIAVSLMTTKNYEQERLWREADESAMSEVANIIILSAHDELIGESICKEIAENAFNNEMTITFHTDSNGVYTLSDGIINIVSGGNVKLMDCHVIYERIVYFIGKDIELRSKTYKNSEYTISIKVDIENDVVTLGNVHGEFSVTVDN